MLRVTWLQERVPAWLSIALLVCMVASPASAQTIDVSLNVFYTDPANVNSGGTWELVGKSSHSGIAGVSLLLTNIATAQTEAPRGLVNGSGDLAGFSQFFNTPNPNGFRNVTIGQVPIPPGGLGAGEEQTVFYGVGTLNNGAPKYAGQPLGSNSIGPAFTSLTNVHDVAWATGNVFGNPAWSTAARLASGTFSAGLTPGFSLGTLDVTNTGNVFTTLGSSANYGTITEASVTTTVRTNFSTMLMSDYNRNGLVEAADYALWRNSLGDTGAGFPADGNGDGMVNQADYDLWRANFGGQVSVGAAVGLSSHAVPEPAAGLMFIVATFFVGGRRTKSGDAESGR